MIRSNLRAAVLAAAVVGLAACSDDAVTAPTGGSFTLMPADPIGNSTPIPGAVKVCQDFGPASFTTQQLQVNNLTSIEAATTLPGNLTTECSVVWLSNGQAGPFTVRITQVGPVGFDVFRLAVTYVNHPTLTGFNVQDIVDCDGSGDIPNPVDVFMGGNAGVTLRFKQCPASPPPPPFCDGLTPGYWKNSIKTKKYTDEQFAILLDGTSFASLTNAQAIAILSLEDKDMTMLKKIEKFLLANQLTLSLMNHPTFKNPDTASLTGTCTAVAGGDTLADAIADALAALANGGAGFTAQQLSDLKDLLDDIANLNN